MYDITKKSHFKYITVAEMIELLKTYPQDAQFVVCGDDYGYIHVEQDSSVVNVDTEEMYDEYPEEDTE